MILDGGSQFGAYPMPIPAARIAWARWAGCRRRRASRCWSADLAALQRKALRLSGCAGDRVSSLAPSVIHRWAMSRGTAVSHLCSIPRRDWRHAGNVASYMMQTALGQEHIALLQLATAGESSIPVRDMWRGTPPHRVQFATERDIFRDIVRVQLAKSREETSARSVTPDRAPLRKVAADKE